MGGLLPYGSEGGGAGAVVKISGVLLWGFRVVEVAGPGGMSWAWAWRACCWLSAVALVSAGVAGLWRSLRVREFGGVL